MSTLGDMAHLPGGGPDDTRCDQCSYYQRNPRRLGEGRCRKAAEMRRTTVMKMETIMGATFSCKFFARM